MFFFTKVLMRVSESSSRFIDRPKGGGGTVGRPRAIKQMKN